ncbi:Helix-turn-helix domain of resolvase [Geopseudomonas sagittaria]|uniref:Helix-turn-helix domain of resolvase n=1 Tax=Geopseudomonas sagittaria TaxID=1135990 RepID=A0A1I5XG19_9GAMM|nr:Helix-turn-helix domain of resolvase [Pseudomonas sagittaria]
MARDNSPKARQQKDLQRKQGQRASHDRILIVTEGSKTEPLYFQEIRAVYRLNTASVEVRHSAHGPAPIQVVEYDHELFLQGNRHNRIQPKAFEQVYAVFDRDEHPSYAAALQEKKALDDTQIAELRRRVDAHEPKSALAREFGISRATLYEYLRAGN